MAVYTAASVALSVVPDLTGFFAELDRRLAGYSPPPIPAPDVDTPDVPPPDTSEAEAEIEGGLTAAAAAAAVAIGAILGKGIADALDLTAARGQLGAQLGDPKLAAAAGEVAGRVYSSGWSTSVGEAGEAVQSAIKQGLIDPAAESAEEMATVMSRFAIAAQTGGAETTEVMLAAGALVKTGLASDVSEATELIALGFQRGADSHGDFLDSLTSGAPVLSQFGLIGADAIGLMIQALEAGAPSADFFSGQLEELAGNAGDSADTFTELGLAGAEFATRLTSGGETGRAALNELITALQNVEDPAKRATLATGLFGEEGVAMSTVFAELDMSAAAGEMEGLAGTIDRAGASLDTPQAKVDTFVNTALLGLSTMIADHVLPAVDGFLTTMDGFLDIPGVPDVLGFILSSGAGVAVTLGVIAGAVKVWTGAQWLWNAAMAASPLTWVAVILGALVGAMIYAYNTSEDFRRIVDGVFAAVGEAGRWLWEDVLSPAFSRIADAWDKTGKSFGWIFDNIIKPPFQAFPGFIDGIVQGLGWAWDKIQKIFGSPVYFVLETVWNNGIGGLWNAAKGFGLPLGDFPRANTGDIPHFAGGGRVPGISPTKTADDQLVRLTSGEWVHPVDAVDYYGDDVMDRIRRREIPRERLAAYARGGRIGDYGGGSGSVGANAKSPTTPREMFDAVLRGVPGTRMSSGYRPGDPGWHGKNRAVDLVGNLMAINRWIAGNFPGAEELIYTPGINLKRGRPHTYSPAVRADHFDHVHFANLGASATGSGSLGSASATVTNWFQQQVRALFDTGTGAVRGLVAGAFPRDGSFVGDLPTNALDWAIGKARDGLLGTAKTEDEKATQAMASAGGGNVAQWAGVVQQALAMLGLSPSLVSTTLRRMDQESGGNPRAINNWDSNAARGTPSKGLMQVIDPTFRANYDPRTPNDIWNPLSNIVASMKYALRRYGSLPRAYDRPGGYDDGGELYPGLHMMNNRLPHSETVIPLPPDLVNNLLKQGAGRGSAVAIERATFMEPVDLDVLMQRADYLQRTGGM